MPSLDLLFAWTIAILAGAACIGALVVVLVREFYAVRETIRRHRVGDARNGSDERGERSGAPALEMLQPGTAGAQVFGAVWVSRSALTVRPR